VAASEGATTVVIADAAMAAASTPFLKICILMALFLLSTLVDVGRYMFDHLHSSVQNCCEMSIAALFVLGPGRIIIPFARPQGLLTNDEEGAPQQANLSMIFSATLWEHFTGNKDRQFAPNSRDFDH